MLAKYSNVHEITVVRGPLSTAKENLELGYTHEPGRVCGIYCVELYTEHIMQFFWFARLFQPAADTFACVRPMYLSSFSIFFVPIYHRHLNSFCETSTHRC